MLLSFSYVPDNFYSHVIAENCLCIWRFNLLLSFLYVPNTFTQMSLLKNQTVCVSGGSICYCLFHMYLTHFYSHGVTEKPHCLCIWRFNLLLSFSYVPDTFSFTHMALLKNHTVYLGVRFVTVCLVHAGHTFTNLACLLGFLICYCVIGTYGKQIVEKT